MKKPKILIADDDRSITDGLGAILSDEGYEIEVALDGQKAIDRLATDTYHGVVTTYRSDGKGNMAHEAEIVCFDGTDRIPKSTARYTIPPRS